LNLGTASAPPLPAPPVQVSAPPAAAPATKTGGQIQPAELIKRRDPEFPKLARDAGAKGMVQLLATVGTDGHVKAVKIVKGHPLLVRAASDAVMQWIYRPTILNGVAVETTTEVTLNFVNER
jgi:protein TonB